MKDVVLNIFPITKLAKCKQLQLVLYKISVYFVQLRILQYCISFEFNWQKNKGEKKKISLRVGVELREVTLS